MPAKSSTPRKDRDIFRLAPTSDAESLETIAKRLEFRGTDAAYVALSQGYFDQLPLAAAQQILAIGCGTGLEVRALKRRTGTEAAIIGIDHSRALIEVAERLTREEGLLEGIQYQVGDAHRLPFDEEHFDIVILHTLLSHVDDPLRVLREAQRVARLGGTVAIFDGDYASLTWAYPDPAQAREIEEQLLQMVVANPRVMRDMPQLIHDVGLELISGAGVLYADIGSGSFWANAAELFGTVLARSGLLPQSDVEEWQHYQARAVETNTFFGASNYYTYLARRPLTTAASSRAV